MQSPKQDRAPDGEGPEVGKPQLDPPTVDGPAVERPGVDQPGVEQSAVEGFRVDGPSADKPSEAPGGAGATSSHHREVVREGVTMALYVSLSLLAVVLATPTSSSESHGEVARTVFLTAIGLLLAHMLAFSVSSRLVSKGQIDAESRHTLGVQATAGFAVAVVATIPLLLLDPPLSARVAELVLLGFVAAVGFTAARQAGVSRGRALIYVAALTVLVGLAMAVKAATHH